MSLDPPHPPFEGIEKLMCWIYCDFLEVVYLFFWISIYMIIAVRTVSFEIGDRMPIVTKMNSPPKRLRGLMQTD